MIKLTNILNELNINNPNVTVEKVNNYYLKNILNNRLYPDRNEFFEEYKQICKPYIKKYDDFFGFNYINTQDFHKLSQSDLNKFYREMRALVHKHIGTEILNELNINKPKIESINTNDIYDYEYLGGNTEIDKYITPHSKLMGYKVFSKYLYLLNPMIRDFEVTDDTKEFSNKYIVYHIKYFKLHERQSWWKFNDAWELDPPMTLNNIAIIGNESKLSINELRINKIENRAIELASDLLESFSIDWDIETSDTYEIDINEIDPNLIRYINIISKSSKYGDWRFELNNRWVVGYINFDKNKLIFEIL